MIVISLFFSVLFLFMSYYVYAYPTMFPAVPSGASGLFGLAAGIFGLLAMKFSLDKQKSKDYTYHDADMHKDSIVQIESMRDPQQDPARRALIDFIRSDLTETALPNGNEADIHTYRGVLERFHIPKTEIEVSCVKDESGKKYVAKRLTKHTAQTFNIEVPWHEFEDIESGKKNFYIASNYGLSNIQIGDSLNFVEVSRDENHCLLLTGRTMKKTVTYLESKNVGRDFAYAFGFEQKEAVS